LIAIVTVPVIFIVIILFLCFLIPFLKKRIHGNVAPSATAVARMDGNPRQEDIVNLIVDNANRESV
jgi:hypothetical protein